MLGLPNLQRKLSKDLQRSVALGDLSQLDERRLHGGYWLTLHGDTFCHF
jgi:hypothetical protein